MKLISACGFLVILAGCGVPSRGTVETKARVTLEPVDFAPGKGAARGFLFRDKAAGPAPGLVVVHGDFGLTDWVKAQARRLAEDGFIVLAVDLYVGQHPADILDAHIMDRGLPDDQVQANLKAAVNYVAAQPGVRAGKFGIIGWDMGGGYALDAAIADPRLQAVVVCYARLTTDAKLLKPLQASVLGIFAAEDEGISAKTIEQFQTAMGKAGKRVAGIHVYPDCKHGFMDPGSPGQTDPPPSQAIDDAWNKIESYFATELKN